MLEHLSRPNLIPTRVVVLGARGFVGSAVTKRLERADLNVLPVDRDAVDLLDPGAAARLAGLLASDDVLVVISAIAPCKDNGMLIDNIRMMAAVCAAIEKAAPAHVTYISSDAVYADEPVPLHEGSCAEPGSLHGVMHLARELMLKGSCASPLAVLRPTLIYGAADTHNGYGPNQFRRLAAQGQEIVLFGEGEEERDHVLIDDVAEIVRLVITHRSRGVLNVATGAVASFRQVAEMVLSHFDRRPAIVTMPRKGPMPHKGYRPFDISACRAAFPEFHYTPLAEGIARAHEEMMRMNHG